MASGPVRFNQRPRFGVDPARELLLKQRFTQRGVGLLLDAAQKLGGDGHHGRETQPAQAEMGQRRGQFHKIARGQIAAAQLFANQGDGGIAANNRAVEIEQRADSRPFGGVLNGAQQGFERSTHAASSPISLYSPMPYPAQTKQGRPLAAQRVRKCFLCVSRGNPNRDENGVFEVLLKPIPKEAC